MTNQRSLLPFSPDVRRTETVEKSILRPENPPCGVCRLRVRYANYTAK